MKVILQNQDNIQTFEYIKKVKNYQHQKKCEKLCIKVHSNKKRINYQNQEIQFHINELNEIKLYILLLILKA